MECLCTRPSRDSPIVDRLVLLSFTNPWTFLCCPTTIGVVFMAVVAQTIPPRCTSRDGKNRTHGAVEDNTGSYEKTRGKGGDHHAEYKQPNLGPRTKNNKMYERVLDKRHGEEMRVATHEQQPDTTRDPYSHQVLLEQPAPGAARELRPSRIRNGDKCRKEGWVGRGGRVS